MGKKS